MKNNIDFCDIKPLGAAGVEQVDGCFAKGTLVHTEQGLVPIQDIKAGDRVLAKPESGEGEVSYKPVLKTFKHKDKELWLVVAEKHTIIRTICGNIINPAVYQRIPDKSEIIATPNHPLWVVGMALLDTDQHVESIVNYPQAHWKRVDQLQQHEVVVNKDGILFIIERAQPLFHFKDDSVDHKSSYFWFQDNYNESIKFKSLEQFNDSEESKDYTDYQEYLAHEFKQLETGWVRDISHYYETGRTGLNIKSHNGLGVAWHRNALKNNEGLYVPFTDTVYNLEVADDHTYFVTRAGIWLQSK